METLDFSCSSRKREEVDGKALADDKTVLSSHFLSSSSFSPHFSRSPFAVCTSVSLIAAECGAFLSRIQILCEEVRSTFESAATDGREERRWRE